MHYLEPCTVDISSSRFVFLKYTVKYIIEKFSSCSIIQEQSKSIICFVELEPVEKWQQVDFKNQHCRQIIVEHCL